MIGVIVAVWFKALYSLQSILSGDVLCRMLQVSSP